MAQYSGITKRTPGKADEDKHANLAPCIAVVTSHLDSEYMGSLEVQIQTKDSAGSFRKDGATSYIARYLSPFAGVTPIAGIEENPGDQYTQKSYGMWFVPPDIGSQVLVIFAEGGEAFWIGCVLEKNVNFQMPAGDAATTYHTDENNQGRKRPVAEINKKLLDNAQLKKISSTSIPKAVNVPFAQNLIERGLEEDETRGLTTSSARRETPSKVFGVSTPGPRDRTDEAPKVQYGKSKVYHNRLGGSSIVMDDGDETLFRKGSANTAPSEYADRRQGEDDGDVTIPHNEMLRLKTRTGHQILMHNSEDLIYIGNGAGTAWVELTSNGKIDIFSEDSISVRTKQDFNFKADRDINFQADRDINLKAKKNITQEAETGSFQLLVGLNSKITTSGLLDINTGQSTLLTSGNNTEIFSGRDHRETTADGVIHMNGPAAQTAVTANPLATCDTDTGSETIMRRVPSAEPWPFHENLNPGLCSPSKTDLKNNPEKPVAGKYKMTPDTFRKGR